MNEVPWLTILTFLPAVIALVVALQPKSNLKGIQTAALAGTLVTLALSLYIWVAYSQVTPDATGQIPQFRLEDKLSWISALHINYYLGMDGVSLLMVLMTTLIWPFVVGVSFREIKDRAREYYCWVLLMETAVLGVFLSLNLVLYYVFWEAMLIPAYFIIGIWGGPNKVYATVKFFLYTMVGSMVMLVSIIALYLLSSTNPEMRTLDFPALQQMVGSGALVFHGLTELGLFIGFFLAFGIKAPVWPFHTWVPDAYEQAPTGGTIILVALKMGLYGFIRFCLPLFPGAVETCAPYIIALSVIGVIYAALVAAMQTDLKRLLAYSSVSHIGVIMLAIFAVTSIGISGAVIQMVSHTITMGALFILVAGLYARRQTTQISQFGGLMRVMPAFTAVFLIATLSSIALPTTAGFTGEFLMLQGSFLTYPWQTGLATTAAIWSAVYMLWMFQRVMYGTLDKEANQTLPDWTAGERWALVPLVILIFFLGLYPVTALNKINPSVRQIVKQNDPQHDDKFAKPDVAALPTPPAARTAER